ncbi:MAG: NAD-dependent epimerase/dehydratase family protein [Chloroflexi bacterium]|nr:NAD-dependent epimerase/dehydratase family protein [Chloroflexota bacterium]
MVDLANGVSHGTEGPTLVTGGCGFVGRHVVSRLVAEGKDVWIVDDLSTGLSPDMWLPNLGLEPRDSSLQRFVHPAGATVTCIVGDVREVLRADLQVGRGLPTFDTVVHLAAVVGGRAKIDGDPLAVARDLAIDADLFSWAVRVRPQRILYASSSAAYPVQLQDRDDSVRLAEDAIDLDGGTLGVPDMTYGWSKLTGEYLARFAARSYGLLVACVRPFSGYGEDQEESYPVPAIAARAARREDPLTIWGSGLQARDFVHIDDCVDAMMRSLDVIHDGSSVNIGSGRLTNFFQVAELFAEIAGYHPRIEPLTDKPVGVQVRYADTTLAQTLLGWTPHITLAEGFRRVFLAAEERHGRTLAGGRKAVRAQ